MSYHRIAAWLLRRIPTTPATWEHEGFVLLLRTDFDTMGSLGAGDDSLRLYCSWSRLCGEASGMTTKKSADEIRTGRACLGGRDRAPGPALHRQEAAGHAARHDALHPDGAQRAPADRLRQQAARGPSAAGAAEQQRPRPAAGRGAGLHPRLRIRRRLRHHRVLRSVRGRPRDPGRSERPRRRPGVPDPPPAQQRGPGVEDLDHAGDRRRRAIHDLRRPGHQPRETPAGPRTHLPARHLQRRVRPLLVRGLPEERARPTRSRSTPTRSTVSAAS